MLISVIVPVYNAEAYLAACLDSLLAQTYRELEFILVDDGSTDGSGAICEAYAARDARVAVYHLGNGGVSRARNFGMEKARGEYILFADADDVLLPDAVLRGVRLAEAQDADIVYGLVRRTAEMRYATETAEDVQVLRTEEEIRRLACHMFDLHDAGFRTKDGYVSRGPIARLVRRTLAAAHSFHPEIVLGEDEIWNLELLSDAKRCVIDRRVCYLYRINMESASMRYRADKIEAEIKGCLIPAMPFAERFDARPYQFNKAWEVIASICRQYYFRKESGLSLARAARDFRRLRKTYPWNEICRYSWARPLGVKGIIKWLLIRLDLVIFFRRLKGR